MLYHTDEKPHSCSVCGRSFKELSTLQNHERIHSGERPFVCETCGKSFRQRVSYLVHRRIHTGVLPYSCDACGRKFRYKVTQRTHKCIIPPPSNPTEATVPTRSVPPLSQEIKQNLIKLRQAQGRRQFSSRIQNILAKSTNSESSSVSEAAVDPDMSTSTTTTTSATSSSSSSTTNQLSFLPAVTSPAPSSPPGQSSLDLTELQRLCLDDVERLSDWPYYNPPTDPLSNDITMTGSLGFDVDNNM